MKKSMKNANDEQRLELLEIRSKTKKQIREERNAHRKSWDGCRSTTILTKKDKLRKLERQTTKAQLRSYCG